MDGSDCDAARYGVACVCVCVCVCAFAAQSLHDEGGLGALAAAHAHDGPGAALQDVAATTRRAADDARGAAEAAEAAARGLQAPGARRRGVDDEEGGDAVSLA